MIKYNVAKIIVNEKVAEHTYFMQIESDAAFSPVRPGQFCHIKVPDKNELLLRRPISLNTVDRKKGDDVLYYTGKGRGHKSAVRADPRSAA